jgi:hypothetical protein
MDTAQPNRKPVAAGRDAMATIISSSTSDIYPYPRVGPTILTPWRETDAYQTGLFLPKPGMMRVITLHL